MKIGFIGGGKMAEAMIAALLGAREAEPHGVFVSDISEERRRQLKERHGVNVYSRNAVVAAMVETLVCAVKPQELDTVMAELGADGTSDKLVISIAAGKRLATLAAGMPRARVVRVMPNLPCTVGEGMSAFVAGDACTDADRRLTMRLLGAFGRVIELPEAQFDAVTALSGSGPAFFAFVMQAMADAAVQHGLAAEDARLLAGQTMLGAARLMLEKDIAPRDLIKAVASPKGTTAAGLEVLVRSDAHAVLGDAIRAAAARSAELSR